MKQVISQHYRTSNATKPEKRTPGIQNKTHFKKGNVFSRLYNQLSYHHLARLSCQGN